MENSEWEKMKEDICRLCRAEILPEIDGILCEGCCCDEAIALWEKYNE